jgi:hypothetical protein
MCGIKEKLGVHAKPMIWYVGYGRGSYPGPEQYSLGWMFRKEICWLYVSMLVRRGTAEFKEYVLRNNTIHSTAESSIVFLL